MNLFNRVPGFTRAAPGWEQQIWRRLPAILLWGTLLPLGLAGLNRAIAPAVAEPSAGAGALLLWDYTMFGVVVLHWTLVLTLALGCFIVRVMKGPACGADALPLCRTAGMNRQEGPERWPHRVEPHRHAIHDPDRQAIVQTRRQIFTAAREPAPTAQIHRRSTGDAGAAWRSKREAASSQ
jgi:hypothetical protein